MPKIKATKRELQNRVDELEKVNAVLTVQLAAAMLVLRSRKRQPVDEKMRQRIIADHKRGLSYQQLANREQMSRECVRWYCREEKRKSGVESSTPSISKATA